MQKIKIEDQVLAFIEFLKKNEIDYSDHIVKLLEVCKRCGKMNAKHYGIHCFNKKSKKRNRVFKIDPQRTKFAKAYFVMMGGKLVERKD